MKQSHLASLHRDMREAGLAPVLTAISGRAQGIFTGVLTVLR